MKFYTKDEVAVHKHIDDIWVTANGYVYNLTGLMENRMETMNNVGSENLVVD